MPKISVIIPCFNEADVLPKLFARVDGAAATWNADYEIICVDDGSRDGTWEILKAQNQKDARWRSLAFARNFGHQVAVSAGLFYATGDAVVIIDADLQDPPEQISRLLEKWREGFQVVYAVRAKREDAKLKQFLAWGFYRLLAKAVPFNVPADAGDFCLLDRRVVAVMNALPERNRYLRGLRAWSGFRQTGVAFERHARAGGAPQYTFKKSFRLAMDGIFSFSTLPLRLATYVGLIVSLAAFLGALFTLLQKIFADEFAKFGFGPGPHGIPTLVISTLFLGGVQLICLGILGEYLGRIYDEVKGRPHWIVQDHAGLEAKTIPEDRKP
jgi:polyisoprenyl-phosphate glycosyltransferase